MTWVGFRTACAAITATLLAASSAAATTIPQHVSEGDQARAHRFVLDLHTIAGMPIRSMTYVRSLRHFRGLGVRAPTSTFVGRSCVQRYASIQLTLVFESFSPAPNSPQSCDLLLAATMSGAAWRTANGLTIGSTRRRMLRLFPTSVNRHNLYLRPGPPRGSDGWWLTQARGTGLVPVLVSYLKGARVAAVGVLIVGH